MNAKQNNKTDFVIIDFNMNKAPNCECGHIMLTEFILYSTYQNEIVQYEHNNCASITIFNRKSLVEI